MNKKLGFSLMLVYLLAFVGCTAKTFPIALKVTNDRDGKIHGAFAKALSDLDIKIGGDNVRYVLNVDVTVSAVDIPGNINKFARINVDANLTDTKVNSILLPFNFSLREGHISAELAEERCVTSAVKKINDDYKGLLSDYLSKMK
jgi:hypothetical protein